MGNAENPIFGLKDSKLPCVILRDTPDPDCLVD